MGYNPEGNTLARQLALSEHTRKRRNEKRLRNTAVALTLIFPAGGAGAYAMQNPNSENAPTTTTTTPTTEAPSTTLTTLTTVFDRSKNLEKPTTTITRKPASPSTTIAGEVSSNFEDIYREAGVKFAIPPEILYGLHKTESNCAGDGKIMNRQGSGARGPMQFMPGTWKKYGVDGDGDGDKDIDSVNDSIFAAANYLSKLKGTMTDKLRAYGTNISTVMTAARSKGYNA